ncbi:phasin family protein [Oceanobacillus sp. FSL H7-0719]|uniref:phasin family protein n=1 Tax=Oceanobacillus sp. FSL H7-0719 TaxID=2954507 RepID=UPI003248DA4F
MSDYLKKGFLLGLGAAISGKEKLEKKLTDLVDKNEISQEQAKQVMNNFIEKGEMKKDEWSEKQQEQAQKRAADLGLATKEDIAELEARIAALEIKLNNQEQ